MYFFHPLLNPFVGFFFLFILPSVFSGGSDLISPSAAETLGSRECLGVTL